MARSADHEALEGARADIRVVSSAFAKAAGPITAAALHRRLDALLEARGAWWDGLSEEVRRAFGEASDRAVSAAADGTARRLGDEDLWLSPLTAPGVTGPSEAGWDGALPEWLSSALRRFTRAPRRPAIDDLDDPGNRIWIALLAAAKALDPVLEEFGLAPSSVPDLGGGHYGIQPRTAEQLDPSGELVRLWRRYRLAYRRYVALATSER